MKSDITAALAWLRAWSPEGPWTLVEIDPTQEVRRPPARTFTDLVSLETYVASRSGQVNLYFVPNRCLPTVTTTPTKAEITHVVAVFFDLDLPKGVEQTPAEFARLRARVDSLSLPPTNLINSGGGLQGFYLLDAPLPASPEVVAQAEARGKAIASLLGSDAVQNVNRLMRLPGTVNIPDARKAARGRTPALAYLEWAEWGRTYSLSDISPTTTASPSDEDDPPDREGEAVVDLSAKWSKLARSGDATDYGGDRSRLVMAFVAAQLRRGMPEDQIVVFLTSPAYGISKHCCDQADPRAAARRQIDRIRERIAEGWEFSPSGRPDGASPKNVRRALNSLGYRFSWDAFAGKQYVNGATTAAQLDDSLVSEIRVSCYDQFGFTPRADILSDVASVLSRAAPVHPVRSYLSDVQPSWDGVPRLETWLIDLAGAEDTPYVRAVSRLILLGAVRRVRSPGCEFQEMLVLISPRQGTGKSTAIRTLCPDPRWFTDTFPLHADERRVLEALSGYWLIECAELTGMRRAEVEHVKSIVGRSVDNGRLPYAHHPIVVPRQSVMFGTTNSTVFLMDRENRRFWPVHVVRFDIAGLLRVRDQLWAEAAQEEATGTSVRLPEPLWVAAQTEQEAARVGSPWADVLRDALGDVNGRISQQDLWQIIGRPVHMRQDPESARIVEAMIELGWERPRHTIRVHGHPTRGFWRGTLPERERSLVVFVDPITHDVSVTFDGDTARADALAPNGPLFEGFGDREPGEEG